MGDMKLGVSITAFREPHIEAVIKQYEGNVDKIVVTCGKTSWEGDIQNDDTYQRACKTSATVIEGDWENEALQKNLTMSHLQDMDYVITSHCDTFFTNKDLLKLKGMDLTDRHYTCKVLTYWKDYETVIDPDISLPTLFVRKDVRFVNSITVENQEVEPKVLPITCYHLSWVDPELVKKKIATYSHAKEIDTNWYNDVYMKFDKSMTDFAPTVPQDYKGVKKYSLPTEIRRYL